MEFSRRGPATGGAGDGHRFPDPPAHGEQEPMLVMRDALLSQLHMVCLRQEIIEAELAKIERDIALCAATGGHLTQTTLMPRPWHGVATTDAGWSQPWLVSTKQPMAQQNAEFDEHKLPDPNKDALLSQLHMARHRQEVIKDELAKIERAMALCTSTGGHQTLTTPMPMPWHGVATADAGRSQACPLSTDQPVAQQTAEFDDRKLPDSNKAVPPSKASHAEKWELMEITIPVKKLKPPMKWNCTVCQVQATCEQNLQQHYAGQKHMSNIATLDPTTKASDQKAKMATEPSLCTEKKTSSIKWSCSNCQAKGTSQSTLEAHLKGKRHQQNIVATSAEGDKNGIPKNVTAQEAKSHSMATADAGRSKARPFTAEQPVAQQTAEFDDRKLPDSNKAVPSKASHAEKWELMEITIPVKKLKPPMKWNCTVCQVQATCEQNLQQHYAGQKHMSNIATLDPTTKASDQKAKMATEPSLCTEEKKTSSIKWSCSTCQANGTSQSTLEAHLKGKRHQQNIAATSAEGDKNGMPKNVTAQEAKSHSMATADAGRSKARPFTAEQPVAQQTAEFDDRKLPDSNKAVPPSKASHAEKWELMEITIPVKKLKPPMKWNCTVCQVQATCEQNLQQHYAGQKHMSNIATLDPTTKASDQKAKMATEPSLCTEEKKTSSIKWSCGNCQAKGTSQSTLEAHLKGKRHQQNIVVLKTF